MAEEKVATQSKAMKIVKIVVNVLLWIFLAFALFTTIVAISATANRDESGVPSFFGKYLLTVATDSMSPQFKAGDVILGNKLTTDEKQQLQVGDVVTYWADLDGDGARELNTHKIMQINYTENTDGSKTAVSLVTYGINNISRNGAGEPILDGDGNPVYVIDGVSPALSSVIAQWKGEKLGGLGNVLVFLQSSTGFLVCVVIPMALFFIYEVFVFVRTLVVIRRGNKKVITAEDEEMIKRRAVEEYLRQQQAQAGQAETQQTENTPPPEDEEDKSE